MSFRLYHLRLDLGVFQYIPKLFIVEVGDPDGLDLAFFVSLLHLPVARHVVACRLVYKKQVDIVQAQPL